VADPAFDALVHNSSEMAAAAKKHADASDLASLSATLKNLNIACADPGTISTVEERLRLVLGAGHAPRPTGAALFADGDGRVGVD